VSGRDILIVLVELVVIVTVVVVEVEVVVVIWSYLYMFGSQINQSRGHVWENQNAGKTLSE